eukprot:280099-Amorphochlora_amoeboformis.AAC.1
MLCWRSLEITGIVGDLLIRYYQVVTGSRLWDDRTCVTSAIERASRPPSSGIVIGAIPALEIQFYNSRSRGNQRYLWEMVV